MKLISVNQVYLLALGVCLLFCDVPSVLYAQDKPLLHELSIRSDNDAYLFINQDQYYTNGIAFQYRKLTTKTNLPARVEKEIWGFSLGHRLYNPYNGYAELELMDRPFTAYIYLSGERRRYYKNESSLTLGVESGFYGKLAFGKSLQEGFHHLFGFYEIKGWDYQLKSSFAVDLQAAYNSLLARSSSGKVDLQLNAEASLGLNQTFVGLGPIVRMGRMNPLYQSAYSRSRLRSSGPVLEKERFFYYKPVLRYRLYDASIEGGLLLHDKGPVTFDIHPWMLTQQLGFMYAHRGFSIDANLQFNTREVKSQATAHQYGSISMGFAF